MESTVCTKVSMSCRFIDELWVHCIGTNIQCKLMFRVLLQRVYTMNGCWKLTPDLQTCKCWRTVRSSNDTDCYCKGWTVTTTPLIRLGNTRSTTDIILLHSPKMKTLHVNNGIYYAWDKHTQCSNPTTLNAGTQCRK